MLERRCFGEASGFNRACAAPASIESIGQLASAESLSLALHVVKIAPTELQASSGWRWAYFSGKLALREAASCSKWERGKVEQPGTKIHVASEGGARRRRLLYSVGALLCCLALECVRPDKTNAPSLIDSDKASRRRKRPPSACQPAD